MSAGRRRQTTKLARLGLDTVPGRSAREWFDVLRPRLLASRPIVGHTPVRKHKPKQPHLKPTKTGGENIYGRPTFRNVIDEHGAHV